MRQGPQLKRYGCRTSGYLPWQLRGLGRLPLRDFQSQRFVRWEIQWCCKCRCSNSHRGTAIRPKPSPLTHLELNHWNGWWRWHCFLGYPATPCQSVDLRSRLACSCCLSWGLHLRGHPEVHKYEGEDRRSFQMRNLTSKVVCADARCVRNVFVRRVNPLAEVAPSSVHC